jgi:hypothetical protein
MKKYVGIVLAALVLLASCAAIDVVGADAVRALGDVLDVLPAREDTSGGGWTLAADDFAAVGLAFDILIVYIDPAPFIAAGLDVTAISPLPNEIVSTLGISFRTPSYDMLNINVPKTPLEAFEKGVKANRKSVGYHSEMDHYNLDFGDGNMLEWAKDLASNDKDLVFVLNAEPLIAAGVDPNAVEGWSYDAEENMFLKIYNIA